MRGEKIQRVRETGENTPFTKQCRKKRVLTISRPSSGHNNVGTPVTIFLKTYFLKLVGIRWPLFYILHSTALLTKSSPFFPPK